MEFTYFIHFNVTFEMLIHLSFFIHFSIIYYLTNFEYSKLVNANGDLSPNLFLLC